MARRAPSHFSLNAIRGMTIEKSNKIRGVIRGEIPTRSFESVQCWIRQCYHEPKWSERAMCALNEIIGGHGVEVIHKNGEMFCEYVNLGDTYEATIVRYFGSGDFYVRSWGDVVERNGL